MENKYFSQALSKVKIYSVLEESLQAKSCLLDFTLANQKLNLVDLKNTLQFNEHVFAEIKAMSALVGAGGYNEDRIIYKRSTNFDGTEARSVHLGVDLWAPAFTAVHSPLNATVHSFKDNEGFGNYGPTIILEHLVDEFKFYTLYGHLSKASIAGLEKGQKFKGGEKIAEIGPYPENGDWPPHLHFQVILNMGEWEGDFPGVAAPSEREKYLQLCPDPNLILNLNCLRTIQV